MSDQNPFNQPPSGIPLSPIGQPKGRPWKPFAAGVGAAAVLGAGVFGLTRLGGDDDTDALTGDSIPAVTEAPEVTLGELDDEPVTPEPEVTVPEEIPPDESVPTITIPELGSLPQIVIPELDMDSIEAITECLGIDWSEIPLDDLGHLGTLGSIPELDLGSLPISIPDLGQLGDLEDLENLDLDQLLEEMLGELPVSIPDLTIPDITMPDVTVPDGSLPPLPFDPTELEACLADLQLDQ